jgi:2',3'-cyclic-nucleotide 2'-phosphodiesterase (5'-nucleotidase family)
VVREINHVRVGFLGLTIGKSDKYPQVKGWHVADPIATAQEWIPYARKECDVLVVIAHDGVDLDVDLASKTRGIDAIIGAHTHTFLYKPLVVKNLDGVGVPIVQDGEFGVDLGRFDLDFKKNGSGNWALAAYHDQLLPVDDKIAEAPDVKAAVEPYVAPFLKQVAVLPVAPGAAIKDRCAYTEKIVVSALKSATGADLAVIPRDDGSGTSDAGLYYTFHNKAVTLFDIYSVVPFHNNIVVANLTGKKIKKLAADSVSTTPVNGLDDDKIYSVAFMDFNASVAYKLSATDLTPFKGSGEDVREAMLKYLTAK